MMLYNPILPLPSNIIFTNSGPWLPDRRSIINHSQVCATYCTSEPYSLCPEVTINRSGRDCTVFAIRPVTWGGASLNAQEC